MEEEAAQEQEVEAEHSGRSQEAGTQLDSDVTTESGESQPSTDSDVIIIPRPLMPAKKAEKLRVEILSLTFDPTSRVALDQSVQRIYVEYRLLGVPMETTETPMSLRKPAAGEEIHYNFTRGESVHPSARLSLSLSLSLMCEKHHSCTSGISPD
uniref:RPGRIP1 C-terminal domain-containing protein n=1 Tax=Lepisosteus oculatus TaxID=7918 RepID=W5LVW0_LEPOC